MIAPMTGSHKVDQFSTTHWSVVMQAGDKRHPDAMMALEALCRRYWFPLYVFVRREGYDDHDAQDLTQAFFARFLEKDYLRDVDRTRGKFRCFLLASMRHFLANARDHDMAVKRGGGQVPLTLDFSEAEDRYSQEPAIHWTAEKLFHRRWTLATLQVVLVRLEAEWDSPGRRDFFATAKDWLAGSDPTRSYAEVAADFNMTEGAVKNAIHRLRRRYRELLREEIAQTVADPSEVDEEIRQLFAALQGM